MVKQVESIKNNGEHLGYCPLKEADLYSVPNGVNREGYIEYSIVYILQGEVINLITYSSNQQQ